MNAPQSIRTQVIRQGLNFVFAIILALLVGLTLLALDGFSPAEVFASVYSSTLANNFRLANMAARLVIIVLVALAAAIPFKAGIWNIGGDGQLTIGGFVTALLGTLLHGLPPAIHIFVAILAGMISGAIWAAIPGYLRLKWKANEIVTTIMMNYVAMLLVGYMVNYPFRGPGAANAETAVILDSAVLTRLVPLSNLSSGVFIALFVFIVIWILDLKTSWGYEWKVLGANEEFARYGGINARNMRLLAMVIGGALAGLAGSIQVLGMYYKYTLGMGGGIGFTGVLIALIAANSPVLILVVSLIFSFLVSGMVGLESRLGVATEFSSILQSLIILLVITREKLWSNLSGVFKARKQDG